MRKDIGPRTLEFLALMLMLVGQGRPGQAGQPCGEGDVACPIETAPRFFTRGPYIYDSRGRVTLLRGANVPGHQYLPFGFDERDLEVLEAFGFNFIRLGISWAKAEPQEGQYNEEYLGAIKAFIEAAGRRGIYVMPEVHQIGWCTPGSDVPEWVCKKPARSMTDFAGVARETRRFWNDPVSQAKLIRFWGRLVADFQGLDNVFGYNLLNEPTDASCIVPGCFEKKLFRFYWRAITAIHGQDPARPTILEPCVFDLLIPARLKPLGPNLVYAPHPYFLHTYSSTGKLIVIERESTRGLSRKYVRLVREAKAMDAPLLIGEFGGPEQYEFARKWFLKSLELQDQYFLSAAVWCYDPRDRNWGIVDADRKPRRFYWEALHRPYPRFTAGVPLELRFSRDEKTFLYRFSPEPAAKVPTEIYVPHEFMPGATVQVTGAKYSYGEDREIMEVNAEAGAGEVRIEVRFVKL